MPSLQDPPLNPAASRSGFGAGKKFPAVSEDLEANQVSAAFRFGKLPIQRLADADGCEQDTSTDHCTGTEYRLQYA